MFAEPQPDIIGKFIRDALKWSGINQHPSTPYSDPLSQKGASDRNLSPTGNVFRGKVVDSSVLLNVYKVLLEGNIGPVLAVAAVQTSLSAFGARQLHTLLPGTDVICEWRPGTSQAFILGVLPAKGFSGADTMHTLLHGATRQRVDDMHMKPSRLSPNMASATSGRAFDTCGGGEAGWMSETGMRVFVNSFMAMLGSDETSNLTFFYHDMLTRLAAYNYEHWTAVSESAYLNDEDEAFAYTGHVVYPWETLGMIDRAHAMTVNTAQEWQINKPQLGKMEPEHQDVKAWHRHQQWYGYLGQGGKHILSAPPKAYTPGAGLVNRASTPLQPVGLVDEFTTIGGRVCVSSVKGISLSKRGIVVAPVRRQSPEAALGDTANNYKASGLLGEGGTHKLVGDLAQDAGVSKARQRLAGLADMHTYIYNYASLQPFLAHRKDFDVAEESAEQHAAATSEGVPNFSQLKSNQEIDVEPFASEVYIDHKYGKQKVYGLAGHVDVLDDGSVLLQDGCGAAISLAHGNIEFSCPGDLVFKSGRSVITFAGKDFVLRAKNAADISTTEGGLRLKAGKRLQAFGQDGVLIESAGQDGDYDFSNPGEAATYGGVVLKSAGDVVTVAEGTYTRTLSKPIVFDAAKGEQDVVFYANSQINFTGQGTVWYFNTAGDKVSGPVSSVRPNGTSLYGQILLAGDTSVVGDIFGSRNLDIAGEGSSRRETWNQRTDTSSLRDRLDLAKKDLEVTKPKTTGQDDYTTKLLEPYYAKLRAGNKDVLDKLAFTFRTDEDYSSPAYKVYESTWQQLARIAKQKPATWEEKAVNETYPFPGLAAFTSDVYVLQDLTLFDAINGRAFDRNMSDTGPAETYATPKYSPQVLASLKNYTIIG